MRILSSLLEPGRIGSLTVKNRIVVPAMGTGFAGENAEVTDTLVQWHARRARGGAGLIIVEPCFGATAVDPLRPLGQGLRADDPQYIPGLTRLARSIHDNGARAAIQLQPGAGAQAKGKPWRPDTQTQPVSPSGVPAIGREDRPRILSIDEIEAIVRLCGVAAGNIKQAGFDMIEILAHGGYLITEFLSPYFNKRGDRYGGSFDNRCRFLLEIVASIMETTGHDLPLTVKFSIADFLPGGWDVGQSRLLAKKLETAGVNGIGISSGVYEAKMPAVPPYFYPRGIFIPFAEAMKQAANIPVFVGGRLNDPKLANKVLQDGKADFIYEGRALIADPDWPLKVAEGRVEDIRPCLSCNECRHARHKTLPIRCSINAVVGKEGQYDVISKAEVVKSVMVVGGGPAGLEAARVAALRGHRVTLFEKGKRLGGLMQIGGVHNAEITVFHKWLVAQVRKLSVDVRLCTEVTAALAREIQPDVIILACGGDFVTPDVPGTSGSRVFSARDLARLLNGHPLHKGFWLTLLTAVVRPFITAAMVRRSLRLGFPIGRNVAVVGGQFPGCSLALALAHAGKKVTVIEPSGQIGKDVEVNIMAAIKSEIKEGNITVLTATEIKEITEDGIHVSLGIVETTLVKADTVILALDLDPSHSTLTGEIQGISPETFMIGDATSFGRIPAAIYEGYTTAFNL
ncbi:MAG: FAD-dependent oxidoreductase [Pseudomonadota bacterium]